MKSAVLMSPSRGRVKLQEMEVPEPGPGELQVRVHAVSGSLDAIGSVIRWQ